MKYKHMLLLLLITYAIVIGVNLAGNYQYNANGNDWHFSAFFVLTITTLGNIGGPFIIKPAITRIFDLKGSPMAKLMFCRLAFIIHRIALLPKPLL